MTDEFLNELRAHSQFRHPNVLPILDFGLADMPVRAPFVVMPMCDGGNLRQFMKSYDFVPLDKCRETLMQVASAIDAAHRHGVLHGDIKPENVLFAGDHRTAYLADFGVAKYFPVQERVTTRKELSGAGSSAYMSPEQIESGFQSPKSDIYSFAIVAYELLVGALPFDTTVTPYRQMQAKIAGNLIEPHAINPLISRPIEQALQWGLHVNRDERPPSATSLMNAIVGSEISSEAVSPTTRGLWNRLEPTGKVAIITATIAAVGGLITAIVKMIPDFVQHVKH
jgi:serine/threonine-protein kinase